MSELGSLITDAQRAVAQTAVMCACPDEPHQNLLHDIVHDLAALYDTADGRANTCTHDSATGVDTTSPTDPAKVWACDHCGYRWRQDGSGLRVAATAEAPR